MHNDVIIKQVLEDPRLRIETARRSFEWFFGIYLNGFITYETAPFQKKMFAIAEDENELYSVIVSFRGSAKTTIMALAYPIWAILGKQHKKFVVIISDTQELARQRLANIRTQFEQNVLLKRELGPFKDDSGQWGAGSIVLLKYGARITVASREQSIRGITHNQHRPDLIILDDVENLDEVKTKDGRDKLYRWFHNDIIPLGNERTKMIVIGNLLHEDSLVMREKELIGQGKMNGRYYHFPIRFGTRPLWPGKYPNEQTIEREQKKLGDIRAWLREFELKIVPEDDQIIQRDWITYYDALPDITQYSKGMFLTGIDLAISQNDKAHFTAMVSAYVEYTDEAMNIYILAPLINKRLNSPEQIDEIESVDAGLPRGPGRVCYIEDVGYQHALVDQLIKKGINAEGVRPKGSKEERLRYVSHLVRNGNVRFPRTGAESLIDQIVNFGVERYDDLADAFSLLLERVMENKPKSYPHIKNRRHGLYDNLLPKLDLSSTIRYRRLWP